MYHHKSISEFVMSLGDTLSAVYYSYKVIEFFGKNKNNKIEVPECHTGNCIHYETIGKSKYKIVIASKEGLVFLEIRD